jgi:hypothetical protein
MANQMSSGRRVKWWWWLYADIAARINPFLEGKMGELLSNLLKDD